MPLAWPWWASLAGTSQARYLQASKHTLRDDRNLGGALWQHGCGGSARMCVAAAPHGKIMIALAATAIWTTRLAGSITSMGLGHIHEVLFFSPDIGWGHGPCWPLPASVGACNILNWWNILSKLLQHVSETLATCVISLIYFCNIHVKQLQHTSKTFKTLEIYICNIGEEERLC
jgi:hypothetical protein